jgi:hypothetical protein
VDVGWRRTTLKINLLSSRLVIEGSVHNNLPILTMENIAEYSVMNFELIGPLNGVDSPPGQPTNPLSFRPSCPMTLRCTLVVAAGVTVRYGSDSRSCNMRIEIRAFLFWALLSSAMTASLCAQTSVSSVPFGGSHTFERYYPIPPDPPNLAAQNVEKLPNGYTEQQMEWLRANPNYRVYPDGTIEHLHTSNAEIMEHARNNPVEPQAPAGWNSRDASDPVAASTPSPPSGVPGPHPVSPASN